MKVKILIADPDEEWSIKAKAYFEQIGYDVSCAVDGKRAQLGLYQQETQQKIHFWAVILSLSLKNHPGSQVYSYIKKTFPSLKVIVLAEKESDLLEMGFDQKTIDKQKLEGFLARPFELDQLRDLVESHKNIDQIIQQTVSTGKVSEEVEVQGADVDFCAIPIDEFVSMKSVHFDIFIKLNSGKYVKILHAGDNFSPERINKYKIEKKVSQLFFSAKDRKKYIQLNNFLTKKIASNTNVSLKIKFDLVKNTGEKLTEEFFSEGIKPTTFESAKDLCGNIYDLISTEKSLSSLIKSFHDFDPSAYTHSYLVCFFSCMLLKQFEWESKVVNESVGMAALLHDIGMLKLDKSLANKPISSLNENELKEYHKHPELAVTMLNENPLIPAIVKQIILQHHECFDGSGFPYHLKGSKTLTFSKVIFLVDEFVTLMVEKNLKPTEALKTMLRRPDSVQRYSSTMLEHFIKMFLDGHKLGTGKVA
jgi:HD-GYP domain-containing protein (c-di-GMP phosphodiesterase class II)